MKKKNYKIILKERIINSLMQNGQKETCEKILLKIIKHTQRSNSRNFKNLLQLAIVNLTPTFKLNKQSKKRGKRKSLTYTPYFIPSNSLRINFALKLLKSTSKKNKLSFERLAEEIFLSSSIKSQSVEQKTELQKQVLSQKRYFYKFRW